MIRTSARPVEGCVSDLHSGDIVYVDVLGAGRQPATVEAAGPMSFHGVPGFARQLRLVLPDGSRVDAMLWPTGRPWFTNPRVSWIGPGG